MNELIDAIFNLIQLLIIIFAIFVGIWITNSHIDRVEDRFKKLLKELLEAVRNDR